MNKTCRYPQIRREFLDNLLRLKDIAAKMNMPVSSVHYALRAMNLLPDRTTTDFEAVVEAWGNGEDGVKIAEKFGITLAGVRFILNSATRSERYTPKVKRAIVALFDAGSDLATISREMGVPYAVVTDTIRQAGRIAKRLITLSEADIAAYAAGESMLSLQRRLHLDISTIRRALKDSGITLRKKRNDMYDQAVRLYESDPKWTIKTLAEAFGVKPGSMYDGLTARGCKMRPPSQGGGRSKPRGEKSRFWNGGGIYGRPHYLAHSKVGRAIKRGEIAPQPCEVCGYNDAMKNGKRNTVAHHDDYNKPLEIRWLCTKCHRAWHRKNKPVVKVTK